MYCDVRFWVYGLSYMNYLIKSCKRVQRKLITWHSSLATWDDLTDNAAVNLLQCEMH